MALVISDRVKETSVTTGSGTITLNGTYGGFQSFLSGIGDGNTTYYAVENDTSWEVGIGTYTQSSNTLSRDTILKSSNSNNVISLNGVSRVFCTYPADKAVYLDADGNIEFTSSAVFENISVTSLAQLSNVNTSGLLTVSGDLLFKPNDQNNNIFTMQRSSSGNFFHAYVDDTYDRTLALHTDGGTSPTWKLGLKANPNSVTAAPDHGYIYGLDGDMGIVANTNHSVTISNAAGFNVKHKNSTILKSSTVTGVHIDSVATAYPALTINGGTSLAANIQEWTTSAGAVLSVVDKDGNFGIGKNSAAYELDVDGSGKFGQICLTTGIIFPDGTSQTTGFSGVFDYSTDIANNTASGVADSGYFEHRINTLPASVDYSSQILANSQSGVAISGWASQTIINSGVAVSGWAGSTMSILDTAISGWATETFITSDTNTTYTAGSGLELVGTVFHSTDSNKILANSASGVAISGWASETITNSGVAVSGWAAYGISANTTNISANTANITLNDTDITTNSASGVAISGWAAQTITNSGVAVSGWANSTFDTKTNTAAISGYAEAIAGGGSSYSWKFTNGAVAADTISTGQTVTISGISGVEVEYTAGDNFARVSAVGLSGWVNGTFSTNTSLNAVSGWASETIINSGVAVSGWTNSTMSALDTAISGWATETIINSGVAVSGWANSTMSALDSAVSGWAVETITNSGVAVSGWANGTFDTKSNTTAISGWASETIINSGVAVSGWANSTMSSLDTAISGWASETIINSGVAVSGWANSTFITSDTNTTYTGGSGLTLVGTEFNVSSLGGSGSLEGLIVDKAIKSIINTEADGVTITFDMNEANTHMATLGGNRTIAVANAASGQKFMLRLKQDSSGSRTVTWFSHIYWAEGGTEPTLTTTANKADVFGFLSTSGGYYDGFVIGQNI